MRFLALLILSGAVALQAAAPLSFDERYKALAESKAADAQRLNSLFELQWEYGMIEFPESATDTGYPGQNDRWTDVSLAAIARRKGELRRPLNVLQTIDRAKLGSADQLNYDLFRRDLLEQMEGARFPEELLPINQMEGIQQGIAQTISLFNPTGLKDYEDLIKRIERAPALIDQVLVLLAKGLETGITPPKITLRDVPQQVRNQIFEDPFESPLFRSFQTFPETVPTAERERLKQAAVEAYRNKLVPALRRLDEYLTKAYVPKARDSIAASALPDGKAWYEFKARRSTTTSLSPKEIHQIGLSEVRRLRGEMEKVIASTGFKGGFHEFNKYLRTDPKFFFATGDELITAYRDISKRIDPGLIRIIGKLPRLPYGVLPIPPYAEQSQTTAYYQPGSPDAARPGFFFANTYDLKSRPKWEMEALTLHEAVPGHHLQIALGQELENVPSFRKYAGYTAFVEGWALYCESLGDDLGLYKDPYSKYGQLTYETWRAIRLVVDTGMHSLGWSRDEAIEFFKENAGKAEHDIVVEIDRYIVWPGQALAYKIGQLKIKELRGKAEKELGSKFDQRKFHDRVLENSAIPLDTLEIKINGWIQSSR